MTKDDGIPVEKFKGTLPSKNVTLEIARNYLKSTKDYYHSPETLTKDFRGKSFYLHLFDKGADIYPRSLWFVSPYNHPVLGFNHHKPLVRTDKSVESRHPWNTVDLQSSVESDFIYATALGEDLIPFVVRSVKSVVLPISISGKNISLIKGSDAARQSGYEGLAEYLEKVEAVWKKVASKKNLGLYDWLDFRRKLTKQHFGVGFKVLYSGSATYLTAAVVDQSQEFFTQVGDTKQKLKGFIAESKTYQLETNNEFEAHYLSAILNSGIMDAAIKPLQTRGSFGPRDIHKRPLMFPIPRFNHENPDHMTLSRLGILCQEKAVNILMKQETIRSIGKARSQIRVILEDEINEIDDITEKLLSQEDKSIGLGTFTDN